MKILVVDDYNTMRRIMKNLLSQLGHTDVDEAIDGGTALQKMQLHKYDLVISKISDKIDMISCLFTCHKTSNCYNNGIIIGKPNTQKSPLTALLVKRKYMVQKITIFLKKFRYLYKYFYTHLFYFYLFQIQLSVF